jgi:hypothetical protein
VLCFLGVYITGYYRGWKAAEKVVHKALDDLGHKALDDLGQFARSEIHRLADAVERSRQ